MSWALPAAPGPAPERARLRQQRHAGDRISTAVKSLAPPAHPKGPLTHPVPLDESTNFHFCPNKFKSSVWHLKPSVLTKVKTMQMLRLADSELPVLQQQHDKRRKDRACENQPGVSTAPSPRGCDVSQPHHGPQAHHRLTRGLLPGKAHPHGKHSDTSFLQLLGRQCHVSLGPPVSDDDEDLGHRGVSAPGEPLAQKVFQSEACLCAPSSELTQEKKQSKKQ